MVLVARSVKKVLGLEDSTGNEQEIALSELRTTPAWTLLGEPGSGKSQAFKDEAVACGGVYLTIAQFLSDEPDAHWQGKALFLDGLDEIRASAGDRTILGQVRSRLKKLGRPSFRMACRAADWYGQSDLAEIQSASPNDLLPVFHLVPLSENDVLTILESNFGITDPQEFVNKSKTHGIDALLYNPQTLKLLALAIQGGDWPQTRSQTFELACVSQVKEENKLHRDRSRTNRVASPQLLGAAGQLFAVMLLSDKSGIALDAGSASNRFPALEEMALDEFAVAAAALQTSLFVPSTSNAERLEPSHRSIAEYLAAKWLAEQIDTKGLAVARALNLMTGFDGKTVASLRGVYGWLALHCKSARTHLIDLDPLTVIQYGDVQPMTALDKRRLLKQLYRDTQVRPAHLWSARNAQNLGSLYDSVLEPEFLQALESSLRDDAHQTFIAFLLEVLGQARPSQKLLSALKTLAADDNHWQSNRTLALPIWLSQGASPPDALEFLHAIVSRHISDPDDELTGLLLAHLYPSTIQAGDLLNYLHLPKDKNLLGAYTSFWAYRLPKIVVKEHLPLLLDQLHTRTEVPLDDRIEFHLSRMAASLVAQGVELQGDAINDERLFQWLSIGSTEYGEIRRDKEFQKPINDWISARPDRYKGLLSLCYSSASGSDAPRHQLFNNLRVLSEAAPPNDIGLWHFNQIDTESNEALAKEHLSQAMRALMYSQGHAGLDLEMVMEWAAKDPLHLEWLQPEIVWETDNFHTKQAQSQRKYRDEQAAFRRDRSVQLARRLQDIATGQATPALLFELSGVWLNRYTNTTGDTPLDRFKSYCDNFEEVYEAAQTGFKLCVERADLPSISDIIGLSLQQKEHFLRRPCLLGMALRWEDDATTNDALPAETLERMVCFRLTDGTESTPNWFIHLVKSQPTLVAGVLNAYASECFKAKKDFVDGIYPLAQDPDYREVACIAVPTLLKSFPLRAKATQLRHLEYLLKALMRYSMPESDEILRLKLSMKAMDMPQKVYWLTAGMLMNPHQYEQLLWSYVGNSWQRGQHVSSFLGSRFSDLQQDSNLSARSIAILIELQTPHSELDWSSGGGLVSEAMRHGDQVRGLISKLVGLGTQDSVHEIERLLSMPTLRKIKPYLDNGRHELQQRIRETNFSFPSLTAVTQTLANKAPSSASDLCALVLDHIQELAREIRASNSDLFRQFWSEGKVENEHKNEHSCRDALLHMLRQPLRSFGLECMPEADFFNDKRADIRVSFRNEIELPIEIKGEWNPQLWTAINDQLINQYATAKNAAGHGIYLVLWFGGQFQGTPRDGGKRPRSPSELEDRLSETVPTRLQNHIHVRVVDVSWPNKPLHDDTQISP
jgi:hypothetical protein